MAKISFSYFVQDKLDPKTGQVIGHILRPYIPIRLSLHHGNPTNYVNALVDSGSDRNLFLIQWGQILRVPFRKIKPVQIVGIGKAIITAYPYRVNVWVHNKKYETDADFSSQQETPLLGRSGFFNLFNEIIFEENKGFLHIAI
mgnify:CR=1 FL=1